MSKLVVVLEEKASKFLTQQELRLEEYTGKNYINFIVLDVDVENYLELRNRGKQLASLLNCEYEEK